MVRISLVVAALLLTLPETAAAAEKPEHKSKHARNAVVVLAQLGIDTPEIVEFVDYVDQRFDKGYLGIAEHDLGAAKVSIGYSFQKTDYTKRGVQIKFTPDDSHWEGIVQKDAAMINYRFKF